MTDAKRSPKLAGGWVCDNCGSLSDDEHAPCSCDGELDDVLAEICVLRVDVTRLRKQLAIATAALEKIGGYRDPDPLAVVARGALAEMKAVKP